MTESAPADVGVYPAQNCIVSALFTLISGVFVVAEEKAIPDPAIAKYICPSDPTMMIDDPAPT